MKLVTWNVNHRTRSKPIVEELQCVYILGERFPDVFLRKFRLLDQVIPHVVVSKIQE